MAGDRVSDLVGTDIGTAFAEAGDEYHRSSLSLITSYKEGDLISIQGQHIEIVAISETAAGLVFKLEDDREFIFSDTRHRHRGQMLKTNHPSKPTISVDPGASQRMTTKHKKRKR